MSCNAQNCQNLATDCNTDDNLHLHGHTGSLTLPLVRQVHQTLLDGKMLEAFAATLLHSDGGD